MLLVFGALYYVVAIRGRAADVEARRRDRRGDHRLSVARSHGRRVRRGERSPRRARPTVARMTDDDVLRGELRDELVARPAAAAGAGRPRADPDRAQRRDHEPQLPGRRSMGSAERYVIRLAGNDTHLLGISREVEHAATVAAAGVGVGPEVVAFIRPEGYLVTRFIEGSPVGEAEVREPETLTRVADSLRRIHDGPAIPGLFVPLRIVEAYRGAGRWPAACRSRPSTSSPRPSAGASSWPAWPIRSSCGRATTTCSTPTSSTTASRIRIVDWEYAGMGDPFFDLGNFSVNHELTPDDDASLLRGLRRRRRPAGAPRPADA